MSSEGQEATLGEDQNDASASVDQTSTATQKVTAKRRTKSGCLTCRKRRIKCGEERPICRNCIKSKRECTGYNQPFVYKQHPGIPPPTTDGNVFSGDFAPHGLSFDDLGRPWTVYPQPASSYAAHGLSFQSRTPSSTAIPASHVENRYPDAGPGQTQPDAQERWSGHPYQLPISWQYQHDQHLLQEERRASEALSDRSAGTQTTTFFPTNVETLVNNARSMCPHQDDSHFTDTNQHSSSATADLTASRSEGHSLQYPTAIERDDPDDPWDIEFNMTAYDSTTNTTVVPTPISAIMPEIPQSVSQIMDEDSQRIFAHFVNVTGPCMSIFDKHGDIDPNGLPRMVWTYGLPSLALRRPALAHAILALGALHMANLQKEGEGAAVNHFTHALQRVGKLLAQTDQRHEVSTLATVLVLGYYEVLMGDHSKWSLHLSGAGRLVMEHNYAGMIRTVRRMRNRARENVSRAAVPVEQLSPQQYVHIAGIPGSLLNDRDWNVDQAWVSQLMGMKVNYEHQIQPKFENNFTLDDFTEADAENWRLLMDMYWWYCKQDIFQSMISGDPLQLSYKLWKYCPPRGPFGDLDAAYATVDYLWLIMARLTDFGGKDRIRKQRAVSAQGGQWIPAPGFLGPVTSSLGAVRPSVTTSADIRKPEPPSANEGRIRRAKHTPAPIPSPVTGQAPMYGMIPPHEGPIQMSSSFRAMNAELHGGTNTTPEQIESDTSSTATLEAATNQAIAEHAAIVTAFDDFESALSPAFQPLTSDPETTISTPFGPAIRYHSPTIALMWTFYHVGRILLRRLHPHSPPAAMVSAGVNAAFTREHAQTVGRICGALYAQHDFVLQSGVEDYYLAGGLTETTFSLLFAGVQFQDSDQRSWTVAKLNEIAQVTGWQTSTTVAAACETTWEKVGLAGRGPPYTRTLDYANSDSRINGMGRSMPPVPATASGKVDPVKEHESRFVNNDRNLIDRHGSTRTHWAIGILSVEEDLKQMSIGKHQSEDDGADSDAG